MSKPFLLGEINYTETNTLQSDYRASQMQRFLTVMQLCTTEAADLDKHTEESTLEFCDPEKLCELIRLKHVNYHDYAITVQPLKSYKYHCITVSN